MTPTRRPWGYMPRSCVRCGDVGPRLFLEGVGYVHGYCMTKVEKREREQQAKRDSRARAREGAS